MVVLKNHGYASTTGGDITHGFEMPDFSSTDASLCEAALAELRLLKGREPKPAETPVQTLADWLIARFGPALGTRLSGFVKKLTGADADALAAEAAEALGMISRPKLGSDEDMATLKSSKRFYDDRLGVSLHAGDRRFLGLNIAPRFGYPAREGLRGFCHAAHGRLEALGVTVRLRCGVEAVGSHAEGVALKTDAGAIDAKTLFWSLPDQPLLGLLGIDIDLKSAVQPVGAAIHAFEVDAEATLGPDYIHDFDMSRAAFRYSRPGVYGGQVMANGRSYVLAEVPCHPGDAPSASAPAVSDQIWRDMKDVGFLAPNAKRHDQLSWAYPVAYTLPKGGWREPVTRAAAAIASNHPRIVAISFGKRGRAAFMTHYDNDLHSKLTSAA